MLGKIAALFVFKRVEEGEVGHSVVHITIVSALLPKNLQKKGHGTQSPIPETQRGLIS